MHKDSERRKFIRLDRVFPVEFQFLDQKTGNPISSWHQGFTDNVSRGGIGITINDPDCQVRDLIDKKPDMSLKIKMPFSSGYIHAKVESRWLVKRKDDDVEQYFIGASYKEINLFDSKRILKYAYIKKFTPIVILGVIAILFASISFSFYFNVKLIKSNLGLAHDSFSIIHKSRKAKDSIKEIKKEKDELDLMLSKLSIKDKNLNEKLAITSDEQEKQFITSEIEKVQREIASINERIDNLYIKEVQITDDLLSVEKKNLKITEQDIQGMYLWLKSLQDVQSGEITIAGISSKGQLLICQLYTIFGDYDKAKNILDLYFKSNLNKLETKDKLDLILASIKYAYIVKDISYLKRTEDLISSLLKSKTILSDENIYLKLYAALDSYLRLRWNPEFNEYYKKLSQSIPLPSDPDGLFQNIMIFNFKKISNIDIPGIITNLEDSFSCSKDYNFLSQGKNIQVKGFIFAKDKNDSSRDFIEDTAKMVFIYKLTAKFFESRRDIYRAKFYRDKANLYMNELANLVEVSNSYKFMPYVFGSFTGQPSVSATVYTIFAYYNYNPFGLDE